MVYFLKVVEIENFKSYKGRIVIGPLHKFTAIIGPNGSGKSNLMDAISFVLGESTKNLRVQKYSDLIHGSPINKPVSSRASVCLIFVSNDEKENFQRKIFQRSIVENLCEFRCNDRRVSSEEYAEQLEQIGIVPRAKNFLVFQGQIESIAMKTAKELTNIFEEISRSVEFKEQYEKAKQEKIKAEQDTHLNFQKKRGVEKQKKEVRFEKEVAQKFNELKKQNNELQLRLKLFQLFHNEQNLKEKRDLAKKQREDLKILEKSKSTSDEQIKSKKKVLAISNKEFATDEQKIKELESQIDKTRPIYIKAKENSAHQQKKLDLAKKTLNSAEKSHLAHNEQIEKYENDLREVERLRKNYEEKLREQSEEVGKNLSLEEDQVEQYRKLKEEVARQTIELSEQLDSIDREQQIEKTNLEQEQRIQREHLAQVKQTESRIEELGEKIDKLNGYIVDLEQEIREKQSDLHLMERDVGEGRRRCAELEQEIEAVSKEIGEAKLDRNETSRAQRRAELIENLKQFPGVHGRLIDLCEPTHKRFQVAITKVLGRHIDSIVVERETTVQSCLRYMKEHRYESETFLPLDYLKVAPINEQLRELQEPKNVKLILDVIKFDKQYFKALLFACGNALVCENDEDARRLAYGSSSNKNKVVSISGTLFSKSGVISAGSSELKARAKRWDEKQIDALRIRKDKLFDQYKEQQKKKRRETDLINVRGQIQQLENRLRYAKTDKETAERRKKIFLEKQLENFREQLKNCEPKVEILKISIEKREEKLEKIREQIYLIEDRIFEEFCSLINVQNIRIFEQRELLAAEKRAQQRLEFENQINQIQTMLEFERSRDTAAHVEEIQREVQLLDDALQKSQNNEKKYRKTIEDVQNEINKIKMNLLDEKRRIESDEVEINEINESAGQLNREYNEQRKRLQLIESDIEKLRTDRHNFYRTAKLNGINLPFRGKSGSMASISLAESCSSDEIGSQIDSSAADGIFSSQIEQKEIFDVEDAFEINFRSLNDELKSIRYEEIEKFEKLLMKQISEIENQLEKHFPQSSTIDARSRELRDNFQATNAEFERARNAAKIARENFEKIRKKRFELFDELFQHVADSIDKIYKTLTNSPSAVATVTAEDSDEPFRHGIHFNCVAPGKRFQSMENLSGGEKTIAAISLLFALRSFKPAPFFLLDEVDAALDNANLGKLADFIRQQSNEQFQCIVISLKEQFYSNADALVGIYPEPGDCITSHCLTLDLNHFDDRENIPIDDN